nr:nucleotide exchange factor GrpE [Alkalibacter mobilis]
MSSRKKEEKQKQEDLMNETDESVKEENLSEDTQKNVSEESDKEKDLKNQLMRLQADFENYKKRTVKEKEDIYKFALEDFSSKMLPVLDNLERAVKSLDDSNIQDDYANGVRMVLARLLEVLSNEGLKEIDCEGESFDPKFHHGVTVEDSDEFEDDEIMEVFQKGYSFKEKVIRPAMVKICKKN